MILTFHKENPGRDIEIRVDCHDTNKIRTFINDFCHDNRMVFVAAVKAPMIRPMCFATPVGWDKV